MTLGLYRKISQTAAVQEFASSEGRLRRDTIVNLSVTAVYIIVNVRIRSFTIVVMIDLGIDKKNVFT